MNSTDHNLNNPTSIQELYIGRYKETLKNPSVVTLTEEAYKMMQVHDPYTLYVTYSPFGNKIKVYYGDIELKEDRSKVEYLIGPAENSKYCLYKKLTIEHEGQLIPIAYYSNIQQAIKAMNIYNDIGGHDDRALNIARMINSFLDKEITTHNLLLGLIAEEGFGDDPRFQGLQQILYAYNNEECINKAGLYDLPILLKMELPYLAKKFPDSLLPLYSDLFDALVPFMPEIQNTPRDKININEMVKKFRCILEV